MVTLKYTITPHPYKPTTLHPYSHYRATLSLASKPAAPVASTVHPHNQPGLAIAAAMADGAVLAHMLEWQAIEDRRKEIDRENAEIIKALRPVAVLSSERQNDNVPHPNHPSRLSFGRFIGRWAATTLGYLSANRIARR
jgi:hypothetical protein